jgi:signal peptidase I
MNWKWFVSKNVRSACVMRKHVCKLLSAQRDVLSPQAISAVEAALAEMQKTLASGADNEAVKKQMVSLENAANKWLKPYPHAVIRENVEVLLVALAVALGIRTFFLQPFKIPTGSMQPTLNGVKSDNLMNQPEFVMPGLASRFLDYWINGNSYFDEIAPEDGRLEAVSAPTHFLLFNLDQKYEFNGQWHTVWFPPDDLFQRAGYVDRYGSVISRNIKAGSPILRMKVTAGDHLFVDRLTYNFRHPQRGEIVVFETRGIPEQMRALYGIPADQFYIKRLVALGGEHIQIGDDRHLVIDGKRLDAGTPHFARVYGFDPSQPPKDSQFSGHVNGHTAPYGDAADFAPLFKTANDVYNVDPGHYLVMGDNTMNSLDSRFWGELPDTSVIGKYLFVYWPFSTRFGLSVQ